MDFSAAVGVLQGLVQAEGGSSGDANQISKISSNSASILSAGYLPANGDSFWQASADANISINALSRCGRISVSLAQ